MFAYRLTLAYDGTDFVGWQTQTPRSIAEGKAPRAQRTIQGEVESCLSKIARAPVGVVGAGRTDSGVHALGQVASFALPTEIEASDLARAMNGLLPEDVRVLEAARAPEGFDARRDAVSKVYRYALDIGPVRLPQRRRFAGWSPSPLDEKRVREVAALYRGRHDFASTASSGGSVRTTIRSIRRSEVALSADEMVYEVEADGFLRKMVRSLVGGLLAAGRGALSVADLERALEARDRGSWPPPAEACGLALVRVEYPPVLE